jgi:DNA-binding PadR family transcriptional regulator
MLVSTLGTAELTPRMMVLGLVVQEEDTAAGVERRLADQFASARFPRKSAYKNLPSLAKQGLVRLVEKGPPKSPGLDRYEPTSEGVRVLREWLRRTELPPAIRDVVQCKLEFVERETLEVLIRIIQQEEEAYIFAHDVVSRQVRREQRMRLARPKEPVGWRAKLRGIQAKDEATLWGLMARRLEGLRGELEELLAESFQGGGDDG